MTPGDPAAAAFCRGILPRVSRTFALGIRLLPGDLERAVRVAYLLCRIADTIEDSAELPREDKRRLLDHWRRCLESGGPTAGPVAAAFARERSHEERLAHYADLVLAAFRALSTPEQDAIRPWVQEMARGMAEFAGRPDRSGAVGLEALASVADLDRYCYYVAGTVGHLLTELFRLHHPAVTGDRYRRLEALATSFGLGLQLTNIIKDVADDRRRGWSFVPRELCQMAGIRPEELQDTAHIEEARRVMHLLIEKARGHLGDALTYSVTLPRTAYRIRIFCLTSLYFAVRTLRAADTDPRLLDPSHRVKITRGDVYRTVAVSHLVAPFDSLVRRYYRALARA